MSREQWFVKHPFSKEVVGTLGSITQPSHFTEKAQRGWMTCPRPLKWFPFGSVAPTITSSGFSHQQAFKMPQFQLVYIFHFITPLIRFGPIKICTPFPRWARPPPLPSWLQQEFRTQCGFPWPGGSVPSETSPGRHKAVIPGPFVLFVLLMPILIYFLWSSFVHLSSSAIHNL